MLNFIKSLTSVFHCPICGNEGKFGEAYYCDNETNYFYCTKCSIVFLDPQKISVNKEKR
jgi:hypothetical protein